MQYREELHRACQTGDDATVLAQLARGTSPYSEASDGATPIFVACWYGHVHVVRTLLQHVGRGHVPLTTSVDGGTVIIGR
jgi:ankyrin repeat protein